jgi:hypothetical protein
MLEKFETENLDNTQSESPEGDPAFEQRQFNHEQLVGMMNQRLESGEKLHDDFTRKCDELENQAGDDYQKAEEARRLKKRSSGIWEAAKTKIMHAGAIGLAVLAVSGAGEFGSNPAYAAEISSRIADAEIKAGKKEVGQDLHMAKMAELRRASLLEADEHYAVFAGKGGHYAPVLEGIGGKTFFDLNCAEIASRLKLPEVSEIEIVHTHPLATKKEFASNNADAGKKYDDNVESVVLPPSFQDIQMAVISSGYFGELGLKVENTVIDPSGEWRFSVDPANGFVKDMAQFRDKALETVLNSLTEKEREAIKGQSAELKGVDARLYFERLYENAETKEVADKIKNIYSKLANDILLKYQDEDLDNLVLIPRELTLDPGKLSSDKKRDLISKYIKSAAKKGISMKYLPLESSRESR